jgi:protocatechuate 3,4-dioxygenase beta subunit
MECVELLRTHDITRRFCVENHDRDLYDLGLAADLAMLTRSPLDRRHILKLGALGIGLLLTGCTTSASTSPSATAANASSTTAATACVGAIPQETAGPYPADGSNASNQTLNVLTLSDIVRSDIRTSIGTKNVAQGVPCQIELTLVNSKDMCTPLANYAVYLWHCDRDGKYSLYSNGVTDEDYLRGVQAAASDGKVTFTSIFPACYSGRWPHIHFEIYPSLEKATASSNAVHTSQLALPEEVCKTVYATEGYSASVQNLSQTSLKTDNVFGDGYSLQVATVTGDVTNGYTAQLTVGIDV